jgi:hypothetical protein
MCAERQGTGAGTMPTVTNETALNAAIVQADSATSGSFEIDISGTVALTSALEAINLHSGVSLTISGGTGAALDGLNTQRGLFVYSGDATIENLTIKNAKAVGGAGGSAFVAGGGGAGLGGGLLVAGSGDPDQAVVPVVTLLSVGFIGDSATGGAGGAGGGSAGDGGGGGLGGNGGSGSGGNGGGGGGVGTTALGGAAKSGGTGIIPGTPGGGAGFQQEFPASDFRREQRRRRRLVGRWRRRRRRDWRRYRRS